MDVSDGRCPDNPEDSGGVLWLCVRRSPDCALCGPRGHHMEGGGVGGTKAYLSIARCTSILYTPHKTPSDHARAGLMKADQTVEAPTPPIEEEDGGWG